MGADRDAVGADFLSWGWRVAFWLSAVVVLIGYYIRTKVSDAPIFVAAQQEVERVKAVSYGVVEVLKRYPRGVFTAMGLRFAENIMYYLVVIVSITYLKVQVGVDTTRSCATCSSRTRCTSLVIPLVGRLADRVGRRPVYFVGTVLAATWGFFAFPMMDTANYLLIIAAIVIGLVIHALMYAPQPAIMAEMFPTRMRYSGVSLGYQVTSIVAGSRRPPSRSSCWRSTTPGCRSRSTWPSPRRSPSSRVVHAGDEGARPGVPRRGRPRRPGEGRGRMTALEGRTALVTGGASGIGAACARELAARGAVVTVADLDDVGAKAVADEIGGKPWAVDLSDVGALEQLQLETDILVNNAGSSIVSPIADFPPDRFRSHPRPSWWRRRSC